MSAQYAPGEVAIITIDGQEHRAMRDCADAWLIGDLEENRVFFDRDGLVTSVRRVYLLDLRNDRRVQILADELSLGADEVRRAVRGTFPRPEEPVGFGAIALDIEGRRWIRDGMEEDAGPWFYGPPPKGEGWKRAQYSEIPVVEILSEGVPA